MIAVYASNRAASCAYTGIQVHDPDGRQVELSAARWRHIVDSHPELKPHLELVLAAVRDPDLRFRGRGESEEWFYLGRVGPSRWLKVVVSYEGRQGRIITAFPRRAMP